MEPFNGLLELIPCNMNFFMLHSFESPIVTYEKNKIVFIIIIIVSELIWLIETNWMKLTELF